MGGGGEIFFTKSAFLDNWIAANLVVILLKYDIFQQ